MPYGHSSPSAAQTPEAQQASPMQVPVATFAPQHGPPGIPHGVHWLVAESQRKPESHRAPAQQALPFAPQSWHLRIVPPVQTRFVALQCPIDDTRSGQHVCATLPQRSQ
jgi:hypothetical protein